MSANKSKNRSATAQQKRGQGSWRHSIDMWLKFAPTYKIPGVKLSELNKQPKNRKDDIKAANTTISQMAKLSADACSARFVDDESGETLACVFSHRLPTDTKEKMTTGGLEDRNSVGVKVKVISYIFLCSGFCSFKCSRLLILGPKVAPCMM